MAKKRKYSYWEQRRARELYGLLVTAEESAEQLRQVYFAASRETEEEAIRIARRFQLKHNLTEKEAFALLEKVRDPADIKAVMRQLKKNPKNAALVAEAEAPAYAARIRQLQNAQKGVDQTAQQLFQTTKAKTDETLEYIARESYYREAFALDQQIGAAFPFGELDPQDVQKILDTRWEGANYSERIWNNTQALADRVKREMLVSILTGKTNEKIAREIANDFGVSFNAARRLVRTEACYVSNQIQLEIYKRTGVKEYIYSAILDMRTSPVCRSLDGKRFKVKKAQVGKNYPPMHPWCRSTTIAAMPESLLEKLKRTARDAFGRLINVPASMTYEDWKQKIFGQRSNTPIQSARIEKRMPQTIDRSIDTIIYRSAEELEEVDHWARDVVNRHLSNPSKHTGVIHVMSLSDKRVAFKQWDCSIYLNNYTSTRAIIHENIHAHSISYYDSLVYDMYKPYEEAPVEILAQEICIREGVALADKDYKTWVAQLREYNASYAHFASDYDFAREMLKQKPQNRRAWLQSFGPWKEFKRWTPPK